MSTKISDIGGFGTGELGSVTISSTTQLNSYARVSSVSSNGYSITISSQSYGRYGRFAAGEEIMFHVSNTSSIYAADYGVRVFARIMQAKGNLLTLNTKLPITNLTGHTCQIVSVPNFNNLTLTSTIRPLKWNSYRGGIIVFRCSGTFNVVNGKLNTPKLTDDQKAFLKTKAASKITVFGGTGAVPDELVKLIAQASV